MLRALHVPGYSLIHFLQCFHKLGQWKNKHFTFRHLQAKVCARSIGWLLVQACTEKSVVR